MAKIPFSKLGLKVNNEVVTIPWGEYEIEVRKYLPIEEKITLISDILNLSVDENNYYNPLRVKVFLTLESIYAYTNLSFTEKQKENYLKLYDIFISSGLFSKMIECIPEDEWNDFVKTVRDTIANIYEYKNSAMGILEMVTEDYNGLNLDAQNIQAALSDPNNLTLLKDVMTKLG